MQCCNFLTPWREIDRALLLRMPSKNQNTCSDGRKTKPSYCVQRSLCKLHSELIILPLPHRFSWSAAESERTFLQFRFLTSSRPGRLNVYAGAYCFDAIAFTVSPASLVTRCIGIHANPGNLKRHLPSTGAVKVLVPFLCAIGLLRNKVNLLIDNLPI